MVVGVVVDDDVFVVFLVVVVIAVNIDVLLVVEVFTV